MATVFGSSGNDFIHELGDGLSPPDGSYTDNTNATPNDDLIFSGGGGTDWIYAGSGNDNVQFASDLDATDRIYGGSGTDVIQLQNLTNVVFGANSLFEVEEIDFLHVTLPPHTDGFESVTMNDANVAAGQTFIADASAVDQHTFITFDGSAELDAYFTIIGGQASDTITGGALSDTFDLSAGGNDTVSSGGGYDTFDFGNALTPEDSVHGDPVAGGALVLSGDSYQNGFVFLPTTAEDITSIGLDGNFHFSLTMDDANVAAGTTLIVNCGGDDFDGSAETDGQFVFHDAGSGNSALTGGAQADTVFLHDSLGGVHSAIAKGGDGDDVFFGFYEGSPTTDQIDGGGGKDTVYTNQVQFGSEFNILLLPDTLVNVEKIVLGARLNAHLTTDDATVAHGKTLTVDGTHLAGMLSFEGTAETNGTFNVLCGVDADVITGGSKGDTMTGGGAGDTMTGGGGADTFVFKHVSDSASITYDTITDLSMGLDHLDAPFNVAGVDAAISAGKLRSTNFDHDLSQALSGHLGKHHAVLFTPDAGDMAGQTFLIVDRNGHGYHGGADLVIDVTGTTGALTTGLFI